MYLELLLQILVLVMV